MKNASHTTSHLGSKAIACNFRTAAAHSRQPSTSARSRIRLWAHLVLLALFCSAPAGLSQTVLWQENFDDGAGDSRWYADFGVWQMGSPTVGPQTNAAGFRAFSGSQCATTGLNGNYLPSQDSRLIRIASFKVPAATNAPRLRFWHWYSFAASWYSGGCCGSWDEGSYGYVEIKVGAGTWKQVSSTYSGSTCGAWWRPSVDLSPYAGQTVAIAFHFHSAHNTDVGWYVDDVACVTDPPAQLSLPEGFERGEGYWTTEYSGGNSPLWQIGVPTSGPGSAHGGTNCAATMLAGNYCSYSDSRLISPAFAVPASNQYPRLRFWHYYSFAASWYSGGCCGSWDEGSYGYLEIKAGTNNWQQVSRTLSGSSCGYWWRPSIDLTPYAGETNVHVAFHFHSAHNTDVGWYVDDLDIETGIPALNNPEGFESGVGDWTTDSGANSPSWQIGVPTSGPGSAHGGTNCAATVLAGNYCSYSDSRLVSPAFVVPPRETSPALRFWHWYSFAAPWYSGGCCGSWDEGSYGYVEIKAGTNNWQPFSPSKYTGQSGAWTHPLLDLRPFAGQKIQLAFHFHSAHNTASGWYIDDLQLVHDFAFLLGSTVARTQDTTCIPLSVAASSPARTVSTTLQARDGYLDLGNVTLNPEACWSLSSITPLSSSQWLITLQNACTNTVMGVQTIGSLCFSAVSTQSAFVPLVPNNLRVTSLDASLPPGHAFGGRAVIIADRPLLESWSGPTGQRMLTTYGKPNTAYEIRYQTNLIQNAPWALGWTNTVPASLFYSSPVQGAISNAPMVFFRADEK